MIETVGELFLQKCTVYKKSWFRAVIKKKNYPVRMGVSHGSLQIQWTWLADLLESLEVLQGVDTAWKLFIL